MTVRTYRIQVTGYFDRPEEAVRQRLLQQQPEHDVVNSAFCPEGSFSYTPTLTRFTFRYLLNVDEDSREEADSVAAFEGELRATEYLSTRGYPFKPLAVAATCMDDVKVRRRK